MAITISGENNNDRILAADGVIDQISGINIVGLITASHINVGSNIQLGNAGIITATTFVGNVTGNVNSTSPLLLQTGGSERFRITGNNELGIAGANYGSSGQVLTSGGSGSAVTWSAIPSQLTLSNNADNRVITGGSGTNLVGESNLTFDGSELAVSGTGIRVDRSGGNPYIDFRSSSTSEAYIYGGTSGLQLFTKPSGGSIAERFRINSSGDIQIGTATNAGDALRYVDIGNYNTGNSAGSILRLLTVKSNGSDSTSADIVKYKAGGLVINNNEAIGTAGYISFGTATGGGSTTQRLHITSGGSVNLGTGELTQTVRKFNVYGGAARVTQTSGGNTVEVFGNSTSGQSYGLLCSAGTTSNDYVAEFRQQNGNSRFRIRGDGNIGVANASPFNRFCVGGNTFNGGHGMYANDRVGMCNAGSLTGLMLQSTYNDAAHPEYGLVFVQGPTTSSYNVWSISPDGPAKGNSLNLHYGAQNTNIHSPGNRKFEFDGDGDFNIVDGNVKVASGHGIDFSATANSSGSMTNELLADYEEGTFTPTNSIGMTLTNNNPAFYIKIGRMVHIQLDISFATAPNDTAQCGMIQSLPFTSDGTSGHDNTLGQQYISKSSTTGDSDYAKKFDYDDEGTRLVIEDGESRIDIYNNVGNYRRSRGWLCGRRIRISAWYKTAS